MKNSKQLNPNESLNIISKAINQTKENIKEQSFYFILWGCLVPLASIAHYLMLKLTDLEHSYIPWLIIIPIGWIFSIIYSIKKKNTKKYETYFDMFLKYLWIVIGLSFIGIIFISFYLNINPTVFILLLAGIGTLVSGLTMKFKPLSYGGVALFIFSIVSLFVDSSDTLLVNAIAVVVGYLIPAYLLKKSE